MKQQKFASEGLEFCLLWGCDVNVRKSNVSVKRSAADVMKSNMKIGAGVMKNKEEGKSTTAADDNDDAVWDNCHDGILWFAATQTR
jgi:hypothetical protein